MRPRAVGGNDDRRTNGRLPVHTRHARAAAVYALYLLIVMTRTVLYTVFICGSAMLM